jgi:hypothetical protein
MLLLIASVAAGRYEPQVSRPGSGWVYVGTAYSRFTTEFWTEGGEERRFELPASVSTWQLEASGELGLHPRLAVTASVPLIWANTEEKNQGICDRWGMCDDLLGAGDLRLGLRSGWALGPLDLAAMAEVASGIGYRHGIDDLAAPGDGNTDLIGGLTLGWRATHGDFTWTLAAGSRFEWGLGPPPSAMEAGGQASLRWRFVELGGELQVYDSLGGLDFNTATTVERLEDTERFTVIDNDFTSLAPRLSLYRDAWGLHLSAWRMLRVESGPEDLQGVGLGVSWWGQRAAPG